MSDANVYVDQLKEYIRGRANEISNRLSREDVDEVKRILENLSDLSCDLEEFENIIENAWDSVEQF